MYKIVPICDASATNKINQMVALTVSTTFKSTIKIVMHTCNKKYEHVFLLLKVKTNIHCSQ